MAGNSRSLGTAGGHMTRICSAPAIDVTCIPSMYILLLFEEVAGKDRLIFEVKLIGILCNTGHIDYEL